MSDVANKTIAAALLRHIVRTCVAQGAFCQKHGSFTAASPGSPLEPVEEVLLRQAEQQIAASGFVFVRSNPHD